jgi:hypothetical protein
VRAPGVSCETAIVLPNLGTSAVTADTRCSEGPGAALGCGSAAPGASVHFALDLRAASAATPVSLVIDADFPFEATLARGPCGDEIVEACALPFQSDRRSRSLSLSLPPEYYQLLVTGTTADGRGTISVASAISAASCVAPPTNDECQAALALDPAVPSQSVIGNAACGGASLSGRCGFNGIGDVFYELDLSSRTEATLLEVDVASLNESGLNSAAGAALLEVQGSTCSEPTVCGTRFSSRVLPGRYRIGVAQARDVGSGFRTTAEMGLALPEPFALRVRLRDADCSVPATDTWQTAIDLDAAADTQRRAGNTACARDDFASACSADRGAPDVFYRLDLRGQAGPSELYLSGNADSELVVYVLLPDATGALRDVGAFGAELLVAGDGLRHPQARAQALLSDHRWSTPKFWAV